MHNKKSKKQLFLAGGGGKFDSIAIDKRFAAALDKTKPFAYIPNAMQNKPYNESLSWLKDVFCSLGIVRIEMWLDLEKAVNRNISCISGIYIGGGDTAKLLSEIRNSGFDNQLREIYDKGLPIYGGSAGAIILGQTILTAPEATKLPENKAKGLNLVDGFSIYCHYDGKKDLKKLCKSLETKIIAIPEKSGVCLTDGGLEVVGYERVAVFNSNDRLDLRPGEISTLEEF